MINYVGHYVNSSLSDEFDLIKDGSSGRGKGKPPNPVTEQISRLEKGQTVKFAMDTLKTFTFRKEGIEFNVATPKEALDYVSQKASAARTKMGKDGILMDFLVSRAISKADGKEYVVCYCKRRQPESRNTLAQATG